jgi:hypothetical protein
MPQNVSPKVDTKINGKFRAILEAIAEGYSFEQILLRNPELAPSAHLNSRQFVKFVSGLCVSASLR